MSKMDEELSPADFAATATRAFAACKSLTVAQQMKQLAEDGLLGVLANEDVGGLGMPLSFAVPVVAAASAEHAELPFIETLLLGHLLQQSMRGAASSIVAGEKLATIAWRGIAKAEKKGGGFVLSGSLARAPRAADAGSILVRLENDAAALVPTDLDGVAIGDATGFDLAQPEHTVQLNAVPLDDSHILPSGAWASLDRDALILRAAAILGCSEASLALAKEHVSTRRQFGHALSYNQAIRHALARHKLGLEGIRQAIARALFSDASTRDYRSAYLAACNYGVQISEGAIQMHGGMGFTWDVPVHRYVRRIRALQAQGNASELLAVQGRDFIAGVDVASERAA